MFVLADARYPFTHYFAKTIAVSPLDPDSVKTFERDALEVTGWGDQFRSYVPGPITCTLTDDSTISFIDPLLLQVALAGGGAVAEVLPYGVFGPWPESYYDEPDDDYYDVDDE